MEYKIEGSTLSVSGDLDDFLDMNFDVQASELLELKDSTLTIDLLGVGSMASQYLGALAAVAMEADRRHKRLKVIATGRVAEVIQLAGFDRVLDLEIR